MAAPQKEGLDYFPFDVKLLKDPKLMLVRDVYGYVVNDIFISLLTLLYAEKGYYIPYESRMDKSKCIRFIQSDLIGGKYTMPNIDLIARVIDEMVACELFSGDHYPKNITSKRSQTVYYTATAERKSVNIKSELWLLTMAEMCKLSAKHSYYLLKVNGTNNEDNRSDNQDKRSDNPQIKSNQSKVNEDILPYQSVYLSSDGDVTDGRTEEMEFYHECVKDKLKASAELSETYGHQILHICERLVSNPSEVYKIGGMEVTVTEMLKAILDMFRDADSFENAYARISAQKVKNKFQYTLATFYNASKKL